VINLESSCQYQRVAAGDKFAFMAWAGGSFSAMVLERTAHPALGNSPTFPPMQRDA